jgi:colanic acid biosynthesis glycosyl transferase WcaI
MRILVLAINYWPEQTGIGPVLTRRCEYLASAGHEVTVCTSMPYYPEWRIPPEYAGKLFSREERNGVEILRSWMWVPNKVTSAKRIAFEASFLATSLMNALRNRKPDMLLVVSPPLGLGLSAVLLSRWWKIPYLFDVMDLQPDAAVDLGMLPGPIRPLLYRLESMAYKHAALISTVSEGMRQKIVSKGFSPEKVVVVPPTADSNLFDIGTQVLGDEFRRRHGLHDQFVVGHCGNMGVKQGLDLVLHAASRLRERRDITFILVGDGSMKSQLEQQASSLQLSNLRFLPLLDESSFSEMLAATDVGLIVQQSSVSDIVFPSKTVTLLSAARPVIASVNDKSEIGRTILVSRGGVVIKPEDPDLLAEAVRSFAADKESRQAMGERGRQYAFKTWETSGVLSAFGNLLTETVTLKRNNDVPSQIPASA